MNKNSALITIDFINDIVDKNGKIPSCASMVESENIIQNVNEYIKKARECGSIVIHVKVAFDKDYSELSNISPMFKSISEVGALILGTWGTEFHENLDIKSEDNIVVKHRVSAFYGTDLEVILRANNIDTLYLAGVSTNMAIELTAREAHDRDYDVKIISSGCASQSKEMHEFLLEILSRIADIIR